MQAKIIPFPTVSSMERRAAELAQRAHALATTEGLNPTAVPGVSLLKASSATLPLPSLYEPCLCIVLQGRKRALLDGETFVYDALNYLVVSVTLPVIGQILEATAERPYLALRITLDIPQIAELLMQLPEPGAPAAKAGRGLFVAQSSEPLLDAVVRLFDTMTNREEAKIVAPLIIREIHYRVLTGELAERLRELCGVDSQTHRVVRAIAAIKARFAEPLRIEELAAVAHLSPSALHRKFKALTAMSPLQFQKQLRLHEARRLMLEGMEAAAVAYRVGYESPSQFSREYRRLFGVSPKQSGRSIIS